MAAEDSLLAMDIVVELEDGSIANVEMQKIGYKFPGERSSCYSADLLLRQYQRVKTDHLSRQVQFSYMFIKDVYTIILFENSPEECKAIPDRYIHYGKTIFDTGLAVHMPQEYVYVPLDIFRKILHNRGIKSELDAWLTFLCEDAPEMIELLLRQYPQFRELYNEVYKLCGNLEDVMGYFSEALQEMDRNTVQYMIEEQQEQIEEQQEQIEEQQEQLKEKDSQIEELRVAAEKEAKEKTAAIERMLRSGKLSIEEIAEYQAVSVDRVRKIEAGMLQEA